MTGSEAESDEALAETQYHRISIIDNGIGFEQKYDKKIFELFQRLHTKENYQGFIAVSSIPREGSAFHVHYQSMLTNAS